MKIYYFVDKSLNVLLKMGYKPIIQSHDNFNYPYIYRGKFVSINQIDYKNSQAIIQYVTENNRIEFETCNLSDINRIYYRESDVFIQKENSFEKRIPIKKSKRVNVFKKIRKFILNKQTN